MATIALPIFGVVLVVIALSRIVVSRTPVTKLNMGAACFGLVAFALWPDQYARGLDHLTGNVGVGFYLTRLTITAAATLHIIAVDYGIGRWRRSHQLLLVPPVIVLSLLFALLWALARSSHVPHPEALFYDGYHGRPAVVFWMSMVRGLTILWYSAFGVYVYALVALADYRSREHPAGVTPVAAMSLVFLGSLIIGLIDMGSAAADRAGVPGHVIAELASVASLGLVAIIALFVVIYLVYLLARPSWVLLQESRAAPERLAELQQEMAEIRRVRADVRDLNMRLDDRVIRLLDYADPDVVQGTEEACTAENVGDEERTVVIAAAREITLRPDHILRLRIVGAQALSPEALTTVRAGAQHFADLSTRDLYFYSDVHIVAALALGAERYGVTLRREPQEWHRRLGRLLAGVLERYEQPQHYVAAYQHELERRARGKQQMRDDLGLSPANEEAEPAARPHRPAYL